MSFATTQPKALAAAVGNVAGTGSVLNSGTATAVASSTKVSPAAAEEVSAPSAAGFVAHAQVYRAMAGQVATT